MVTGSPWPMLVGRGLRFAEGINFDRDGTLYCVDWLGGGIWRMPAGGPLAEWVRIDPLTRPTDADMLAAGTRSSIAHI